jgi:hypothetical protein
MGKGESESSDGLCNMGEKTAGTPKIPAAEGDRILSAQWAADDERCDGVILVESRRVLLPPMRKDVSAERSRQAPQVTPNAGLT